MSLPYFRMYPTDYEADTAHLTTEEDGAYNRLLRLCWRTPGCTLPDDDEWIRKRVRASKEEYERAYIPVLTEYFSKKNQRVFSPRLLDEYSKTQARHAAAVENGKKGGRPAKSLENNDVATSDGLADQKQTAKLKKANQNQNQNHNNNPQTPLKGDVDLAYELWNDLVQSYPSLPKAVNKEGPTRKALKARLKQEGIDGFKQALDGIRASRFHRNEESWSGMNLGWAVKATNFEKLQMLADAPMLNGAADDEDEPLWRRVNREQQEKVGQH